VRLTDILISGDPVMSRILVANATMAGSTVEVAQAVGEEIAKSGAQVEVLPIIEVKDLQAYDGVFDVYEGGLHID
jgi:flavodoxin